MLNLLFKKCKPCEGGTKPLTSDETAEYQRETPEWRLEKNETRISREFRFKNFVAAMRFVNEVAQIAEDEGHHPDLHISYSRVTVELWTHAIGGLSENAFIVAAKIDAIH